MGKEQFPGGSGSVNHNAAHVYCGCTIATGSFFDERECGWEGDVPLSECSEDRPFDTFDCPECKMTGLLVVDHAS